MLRNWLKLLRKAFTVDKTGWVKCLVTAEGIYECELTIKARDKDHALVKVEDALIEHLMEFVDPRAPECCVSDYLEYRSFAEQVDSGEDNLD